jgi:hypothetical protein
MQVASRWGSLVLLTATVTSETGQAVVHRFEYVYGTLIVVSDRMDAVLRVDRADYGNVPSLLLLSPGRHKVFLQAANAPDKTRELEVKVGYRTTVRINFAGGSPETDIEPETVPRRLPVAKAESHASADRRELVRIRKLRAERRVAGRSRGPKA